MAIRVVCDGGSGATTRILNAKTGEDIGKIVPISYGAKITIGPLVTMEAEISLLHGIDVEAAQTYWRARHPISGNYQQLASMSFQDGTEIRFEEDGTPFVVGGLPPKE